MTACHDVTDSPVALAGIRRVALIGSPNAGKTSVFNHLTGLRAKTGNYPGVTVGRSVGTTTVDGVAIAVEDLPGTYSLDPISPDEQVVTDLLAGKYSDIDRPDALVLVADATTLRRSIMLVGQVLRLDLPCLLALTMCDELTSRGGRIDVEALSKALGIPVVPVVGHRGTGIDSLRAQLTSFERWQRPPILPPAGQQAVGAWGQSVLDAADYVAPQPDRRTHRIDRVLLHPLWGTVAFFAVMFGFFQVLFTIAAPLQDWASRGLSWLCAQVARDIGNPVIRGLLSHGIIGGVGTVLQFIPRANPKLAMELGAYCGYSGLRIARAAPGAKVFSIEKSGANASVARRVWAHAGLGDRVTCINGTVGDGTTLEVLAKDYGFTEGCLDFVFLDHWKDVYLSDLRRLVDQGWLHPGTIVVADNVGFPGAPEYRAYMKEQQDKRWQTIEHETHVEYQTLLKDLVLESEFLG